MNPPMREPMSPGARRLGVASASAVAGVGIGYVGVIALWLAAERTPQAPIGDPYLAAMEALTIASALALLGLFVALGQLADAGRRVPALATLVVGSLGAGLTLTVHFVQLTAVRQLWRAGALPDYRLVWPSPLFAAEYLAWDVLLGLAMVGAGLALAHEGVQKPARRAWLLGGVLCLAGVAGPLTGAMAWQHVAVAGYALVLPVAAALTARVFASEKPAGRPASDS